MQKFQCLLSVLKRSYICFYINLHDCPFKYYIQPKLEQNQPDKILLHVGNSNLSAIFLSQKCKRNGVRSHGVSWIYAED